MINSDSILNENNKSKTDKKAGHILFHNKDVCLAVNNKQRWFNSDANFNISFTQRNPKTKEIIPNLTKPTMAAFEFSSESRPLTGAYSC